MVLVSFASTDNLASILIADKGVEVYKHTYRLFDLNTKDSAYDCLLDAMKKSLGFLKVYLEDKNIEDAVVFETGNSILTKWFQNGQSSEHYLEKFYEVLNLMDEIPVRFSVRTNKKPYAKIYLDEKYIKKPKLSNFDDWSE